MPRSALVCAAALSLAALGACAREPDPERQVPANEAAAPAPPLTPEMAGVSAPAAQPQADPAASPGDTSAEPAPMPMPVPAPATAADTVHADSGHAGH